MALVQYPTNISSEVFDTLINMIRTKSVDKGQLGLAIWNVQGYVQSILLTTDSPKIYGGVNANPSDEEVLSILEDVKNHLENTEETPTHFNQMGPISAFALKILLQWLVNKLLTAV